MRGAAILFGVAVLACSACAQGQTVTGDIDHERTVKRYDFKASTLKTARKNALDTSTAREGTRVFMGYTWSNWNWDIKWRETGGECWLTDVSFNVDTTMTLPNWVNVDRASVKARQEWQRFMTALEGHEEGHVDININGVTDMKNAMMALEKAETCRALLANAREVAGDHGKHIGKAHRTYDGTTIHGATQGARLRVD